MKITNAQLKQIIKEELQQVLNESENLVESPKIFALYIARDRIKKLFLNILPSFVRDPRGALEMGKTAAWFVGGKEAYKKLNPEMSEEEFKSIIEKNLSIISKEVEKVVQRQVDEIVTKKPSADTIDFKRLSIPSMAPKLKIDPQFTKE